MENFWSKES